MEMNHQRLSDLGLQSGSENPQPVRSWDLLRKAVVRVLSVHGFGVHTSGSVPCPFDEALCSADQ